MLESSSGSRGRWPWLMRAKGDTLALTVTAHSVRYVLASNASAQGATIDAWGNELRGNETQALFLKRVKALLPQAKRVIAVLDPEDYQFVQTDAPNVSPEELRDAVRWRAMEFLGVPPDDLTLDVLIIGDADTRLGGVFAAAAQNDVVRTRMLQYESLGLEPPIIDVAETGQRNLLKAVLAAEASAVGVAGALVKTGERALLTILVEGELFFSRRFDFDAASVAATAAESAREVRAALTAQDSSRSDGDNGAEPENARRSLLQLHRSLDLWDDNYAKYSLQLLLVDTGANSAAVATRLKREVTPEVRALPVANLFKTGVGGAPAPWHDTGYAALLGALLRPAGPAVSATQINLFNPALLPPKRYFSARAVVGSVVLAIVAMAAVSWWATIEATKLRKQVAEQEARQGTETSRSLVDASLVRAQQITSLEQTLRSKQTYLEARRVLRDKLKRGMVTEVNAHSALMRLVAATIPEQVWLTELRVTGNRVEVAGRTLDPLAFNAWMVRLGNSVFFSAKPISMLRMENSEFATGVPGSPAVAAATTMATRGLPAVYSFGITATPANPLDDEGGKTP